MIMQDSHQHHFEERAVFVGCGVRAVGTNESNTYRRTQRKNTVFRSGYQYSRTSATFKVVEFDHFKARAGLPSFTLSVSEWIDSTNAIGLIVKNGRYGGTMKNLNAVMIQDGIPQPERLRRLNEIAIHQMRVLSSGGGRNLLR